MGPRAACRIVAFDHVTYLPKLPSMGGDHYKRCGNAGEGLAPRPIIGSFVVVEPVACSDVESFEDVLEYARADKM